MEQRRARHAGRVAADRRVLGLDRGSLAPGLFVVAVVFLLTVVVPRIDAAVDWDDPVAAGDVLALSPTVVFTPTTGWNVEAGFRTGPGSEIARAGDAAVAGNGVTFRATGAAFDGPPTALLDQVEMVTSRTEDPSFRVTGERSTVVTASGETGVAQPYSSLGADGVIAAFVVGGTGVKVTAFGSTDSMTAATDDVRDMIASIRRVDGSTP